ncbi:hypothetical protein [Silvibacterium dinghuense]|uniref:Uncharacterized protein n=1 Tax=Silvibacterium dinghuense TaxID=1560006 RepID=A0A4V1NVB6_9BACT|nr:hypothetical protein [Silvibacterium dinghuense]RXS95200.1 hypothetical protein ESZ00_11385 [Silvibacterium dinghuense]GGH11480.1 hypothetical protein GCM10011586_30200 [Silvibacterium dinghuense]
MGTPATTPPDPIAPVVTALSFLVTPNPSTISSGDTPSTWEGSSATDGSLYSVLQPLLNTLFSISSLQSVGSSVNTALTDVAKVISTIADKLASLEGSLPAGTSATDVMNGLQSALSMASTLLPSSAGSAAGSALNSASQLFTTIQNLIQAVGGDLTQAANELAQLSQQITALAALF